jgi:hypothetical protein
VVVLPLAEEDPTNKEVGYLIEELHKSGRWPVLVFNVSCEMIGNMYKGMHKYSGYIIRIPAPCQEAEQFGTILFRFSETKPRHCLEVN